MTTRTMLSPGLRRLESIVLAGDQHPSVVTRQHVYDANKIGELIRDVAALANLRMRGPRFIVFGVAQEAGAAVQTVSLSDADQALGIKFVKLAAKCIEPPLQLRYVRWRTRAASLGVLVVDACKDAPYIVRKDVLPTTQVGDAWIRRRNQSVRVRRNDLDKLYADRFSGPLFDGHVRVEFAGDPPSEFIRLTASSSPQLPSRVASKRIKALVASRQLAMNAASDQMTYIGRLSQARIMGCDTPYADKGLATLKLELAKVAENFRAADEHYRFEQQAHSVNLQLTLEGGCEIECASLVLHVPANIGISFSNPPSVTGGAVGSNGSSKRAPQVELSREVIRISEHYDRLQPNQIITAFRQPLSVVVETIAAGHKIPIHYRLQGRNLRYAVSGKLYIICPPIIKDSVALHGLRSR